MPFARILVSRHLWSDSMSSGKTSQVRISFTNRGDTSVKSMWVVCRPLTKVEAWESLRRVRLWEEIKSSNLRPLVLISGEPQRW